MNKKKGLPANSQMLLGIGLNVLVDINNELEICIAYMTKPGQAIVDAVLLGTQWREAMEGS
jgi:hypothetical protein